MKDIRLIALDLDRTTLRNDKTISAATKEAADELTDSNEEDGVAKKISRWIGGRS